MFRRNFTAALCAVVLLLAAGLGGCAGQQTGSLGGDIKLYGEDDSPECVTSLKREVATKTFCVHKITSLTPFNGNCNKHQVGDKLCIACTDGSCPATTAYYTTDDVWLRACVVRTERVDGSCKDIWPGGTCTFYVTLTKEK
jgi:hypothetical protein